MFSRAVNSGFMPVPTSNKEAILPFAFMLPRDGDVICDIILSRVDLPAPFLPMTPRTSPCCTSKLISFKA